MNPDILKLTNIAMTLYEQEQQEQEPQLDCLHDFDYYFSDGQRACLNCGVIDPRPFLITADLLNYRTRSNHKGLYLKKLIRQHQEQCNFYSH